VAGTTPPAGTTSLYAQIAADLRDKIKDGTYGPGALLPGRKEIAARYGVSTITAQNALALLSRDGYARAIKGRGLVVRRKPTRLTVPGWLYATPTADGSFLGGGFLGSGMLDLHQLDVYQEVAPGHIAAPLQSGNDLVWVRRAIHSPPADPEPVQIHHSWLTGLGDDAATALGTHDPAMPWPGAVQQVTGRTISTVQQHTQARAASPFEAGTFGIRDGAAVLVSHLTTYDGAHRPIEHSRFAWPADAVQIGTEYSYPASVPQQP
jgi:DNA-binding GntR family transcriptional regulator